MCGPGHLPWFYYTVTFLSTVITCSWLSIRSPFPLISAGWHFMQMLYFPSSFPLSSVIYTWINGWIDLSLRWWRQRTCYLGKIGRLDWARALQRTPRLVSMLTTAFQRSVANGHRGVQGWLWQWIERMHMRQTWHDKCDPQMLSVDSDYACSHWDQLKYFCLKITKTHLKLAEQSYIREFKSWCVSRFVNSGAFYNLKDPDPFLSFHSAFLRVCGCRSSRYLHMKLKKGKRLSFCSFTRKRKTFPKSA